MDMSIVEHESLEYFEDLADKVFTETQEQQTVNKLFSVSRLASLLVLQQISILQQWLV